LVSDEPAVAPLVRKLRSISPLGDEDLDALLSLPLEEAAFKADKDIVRAGEELTRCFILLAGMTCTYKVPAQHERQIVAFQIPGDLPDVEGVHRQTLDFSARSIEPCRVAFIPHEAILDVCARYPRIAEALWRNTMIDAAIFREWMTSIGRRDGYTRIAHLICELVVKFRAVGLAAEKLVHFPITQTEIGDALGLSNVHVSRCMKELRQNGLACVKDSALEVLDWEGLQKAGDFDPSYLLPGGGGGSAC
jgi:CRP-like cAMP-binding protein